MNEMQFLGAATVVATILTQLLKLIRDKLGWNISSVSIAKGVCLFLGILYAAINYYNIADQLSTAITLSLLAYVFATKLYDYEKSKYTDM